eukprot:1157447-Pelagomonas_calceolata.AAC.3
MNKNAQWPPSECHRLYGIICTGHARYECNSGAFLALERHDLKATNSAREKEGQGALNVVMHHTT